MTLVVSSESLSWVPPPGVCGGAAGVGPPSRGRVEALCGSRPADGAGAVKDVAQVLAGQRVLSRDVGSPADEKGEDQPTQW